MKESIAEINKSRTDTSITSRNPHTPSHVASTPSTHRRPFRSDLAARGRNVDDLSVSNLLLLVRTLLELGDLDVRSGRVLAIEEDSDPKDEAERQ
jgi:hypothetical protein